MKNLPVIAVALLVVLHAVGCEKTHYVTNYQTDTTTIVIYDSAGERFLIDSVKTFAYGFDRPSALVFGRGGNLLVANFRDPGVINAVSPGGVVGPFAAGPGRAVGPLTVDPAGYVYGGYQDFTVKRVPPSGGTPQAFIGYAANPSGLASDPQGNIYVSEHETDLVAVYSATAGFIKYITSGIAGPVGLAWRDGSLYVANRFSKNVVRIDSLGNSSVVFRSNVPLHSLCFDAEGNLFMSTTGLEPASKVYVLTPSGTVSILAHDFNSPVGLAIDSSGSLYVANDGDSTVSKVFFHK